MLTDYIIKRFTTVSVTENEEPGNVCSIHYLPLEMIQ
jgi:hypothetical protein